MRGKNSIYPKIKPGELVFIHLERFFRSKGHDSEESTALAYEAMEELESWYEEKMEGEDEISSD